MASHMRQGDAPSAPPEPSGPRFTPGPASKVQGAGPKRFTTTGHKPRRWWGALIFILFLAALGFGFAWLYVLPGLNLGSADGGPLTGEQTSSVTTDGVTWRLESDLRSPVELQSVTDGGIALRFLPVPNLAFVTVHIVSCEVNGTTHDPLNGDDAIHYTVVNESTGESVETIDPYFITSGSANETEGTMVVIRVDGLDANQYDSLVLGIDQQLAEGDVTASYTTEDVTGLTVDVSQE